MVQSSPAVATMPRVESLLSGRLFLAPEIAGDHLYFVSNLSGHFSLYRMPLAGGVPEPLLPPQIALQNPELIGGRSFVVFPQFATIVVMIDEDGDENYRPMGIPLEGGIPRPLFGGQLQERRSYLTHVQRDLGRLYFASDNKSEPGTICHAADLAGDSLSDIFSTGYEGWISGASADGRRVAILESFTFGDVVLRQWEDGTLTVLFGTPLEDRTEEQVVPPNGIGECEFVSSGVVCSQALLDDAGGLGYIQLQRPGHMERVAIAGAKHQGVGELTRLTRLHDDRYLLGYNIDGVSWYYEGQLDLQSCRMQLDRVLVGQGNLAGGVVEGLEYDKDSDRYALEFSSATQPTQLYLLEGPERTPRRLTNERFLGISQHLLSEGEDASFISHDGLRISARLYLPATESGFDGPRPLVYYVHGGPQGQERPNFAWFSMPLIQFLTLNGFAVFVPNVRGSTGYGMEYMKRIDHDWGGQDRLDHVHAMSLLQEDPRIDARRAAVIGRSYGGYMTLTLATRHPELWSAAVDMFGPYNLVSFIDRLPESWKPYFAIAVGNVETERDFLEERSPSTYIGDLQAPMLVIQGRNDPRVTLQESKDVVENLRSSGKEADLLVFDNEGHDITKFENKVRCYNAIVDFFRQHLKP